MKTGLVLSGGGTRGIAHLGVIKALQEMGIKPDMISGTSAGSIVGAFYAAGFTVDKMLEIVLGQKIFQFPGFAWHSDGLLKIRAFENTCRLYLENLTFEQLQMPLYVAATDLQQARIEYFSSGNVAKAITASSAVPGIFEPLEYKDTLYSDGGILNNFPVEPLVGKCDIIIGVHVNPLHALKHDLNVAAILDRTFHMAIYNTVISKTDKCDLFIEPPLLENYGLFEFKKSSEIFDAGYNYATSLLDKVTALGI